MTDKLKISFGMIVLNGEPFIRYNLENLYPFAHEILIVEGAVAKFGHAATPDGHSLDRTVEIIRDFPDPEHKIKLIQREGFWPEKTEMSNAYMEACTGDYIWQVDVDEFYKKDDISKVIRLLSETGAGRVDIKTINFWRGFKAVMQGATYVFGADEFIRIFKFRPGFRYLTHRPPTLMDENGMRIDGGRVIHASELSGEHGVYMYHYSYVSPDGVRSKSSYYAQMGWGMGCEDGKKWAENCWEKLKNPLRIHLIKFPPSWVMPFEGAHPAVIERMIKEIGYAEDREVEDFLKSDWKKYAELGSTITGFYLGAKRKKIGRVRAAASILGRFLPPTGAMALRVDKTIIQVFAKSLVVNLLR